MIDVIYEDNHLIVVNKKSGDIVQGDKTGDEPLSEKVKSYIKEKYNKPGEVFLGVVHRIDRPVSGVVIFARTSKALARMNAMFQSKEIQKTYWAVVKNKPMHAEELVVRYLTKNEKQNKSYCSNVPS
jgi:23S rRNA pseudouridine1911/1915/1917 synthase